MIVLTHGHQNRLMPDWGAENLIVVTKSEG